MPWSFIYTGNMTRVRLSALVTQLTEKWSAAMLGDAKRGETAAMSLVGQFYVRGWGSIPRNHKLAQKWLLRAASKGDLEAHRVLRSLWPESYRSEVRAMGAKPKPLEVAPPKTPGNVVPLSTRVPKVAKRADELMADFLSVAKKPSRPEKVALPSGARDAVLRPRGSKPEFVKRWRAKASEVKGDSESDPNGIIETPVKLKKSQAQGPEKPPWNAYLKEWEKMYDLEQQSMSIQKNTNNQKKGVFANLNAARTERDARGRATPPHSMLSNATSILGKVKDAAAAEKEPSSPGEKKNPDWEDFEKIDGFQMSGEELPVQSRPVLSNGSIDKIQHMSPKERKSLFSSATFRQEVKQEQKKMNKDPNLMNRVQDAIDAAQLQRAYGTAPGMQFSPSLAQLVAHKSLTSRKGILTSAGALAGATANAAGGLKTATHRGEFVDLRGAAKLKKGKNLDFLRSQQQGSKGKTKSS